MKVKNVSSIDLSSQSLGIGWQQSVWHKVYSKAAKSLTCDGQPHQNHQPEDSTSVFSHQWSNAQFYWLTFSNNIVDDPSPTACQCHQAEYNLFGEKEEKGLYDT